MTEPDPRGGPRRPALLLAVVVFLSLASAAAGSNATLRTALNTWSTRLTADATSVAVAAQQRHPRLMTSSAVHFRHDALAARSAIESQRPSNIHGSRAKRLATTAFADYAAAGSLWAASGRARLAHRITAATADARKAAALARTGNRLLVQAGTLLPA
jgi:hypothetical protein